MATGSIDKDDPLFQLIHLIQEQNSRYLIELYLQAYSLNE
ncbi:sugar O-acetyltransferase, partial [Enterococcus faecalis]